MSFQSVKKVLQNKGLTFEDLSTKTEKEQIAILWEGIQIDLQEGVAYIRDFVAAFKVSNEERFLFTEDPNSLLGRQIARLLGTDICRMILEEQFGVKFAFYNCCNGVVANSKDKLKLSVLEQIGFQTGNIPQLDC
ncbi:MAG: hypothetical protein ACK4NC_03015 [Candidatus Gracilibacteria bacterium]